MQKNFWFYKKDKVIAKILLKKKPSNLIKTEKKKSKGIINKKTFYLRR